MASPQAYHRSSEDDTRDDAAEEENRGLSPRRNKSLALCKDKIIQLKKDGKTIQEIAKWLDEEYGLKCSPKSVENVLKQWGHGGDLKNLEPFKLQLLKWYDEGKEIPDLVALFKQLFELNTNIKVMRRSVLHWTDPYWWRTMAKQPPMVLPLPDLPVDLLSSTELEMLENGIKAAYLKDRAEETGAHAAEGVTRDIRDTGGRDKKREVEMNASGAHSDAAIGRSTDEQNSLLDIKAHGSANANIAVSAEIDQESTWVGKDQKYVYEENGMDIEDPDKDSIEDERDPTYVDENNSSETEEEYKDVEEEEYEEEEYEEEEYEEEEYEEEEYEEEEYEDELDEEADDDNDEWYGRMDGQLGTDTGMIQSPLKE
jgi:hypothetical protein